MAVQTIYLLGTAATSPDWFGNTQISGSAPTAANSVYGWQPGKVALTTPYYRGRLGAVAIASVAQAASYNASTSSPAKGTGTAANQAGDSFSIGPQTGTYPAGNWTFNFNLRAGTAGSIGRINMRMWRGTNEDGTGATQVLANTSGATVTLSTTVDQNSSITANPGALTLNNEYLFLQVEWQETTVGSVNGCNVLFRIGTATVTTTNFRLAYSMPAVTGALAFAGPDTNIDYDRVVLAAVGVRSFSYNAAILKKGFAAQAQPASFTLAGTDATLTKTTALTHYTMPAATGAVALAGVSAGLRTARRMAAVTSAFALTGFPIALVVTGEEAVLVAEAGVLLLTGRAANLVYTQGGFSGIVALPGNFVLSGKAVVLRVSRIQPAAISQPGILNFGRPVPHTMGRW